jgi:hypothetical protein
MLTTPGWVAWCSPPHVLRERFLLLIVYGFNDAELYAVISGISSG